jgi:hypothetical protein
MRAVAILISVIIVLLGLMFMVASADGRTVPRLVAGAMMCGVGIFLLVFVSRRRHAQQDNPGGTTQSIDFSGDVKLQEISCTKCGGALSSKDVAVRAGAVFITCPYCRSEYQIEEAPKW